MGSQNKTGTIVLFSAVSSILYALESYFPKPFPFLRLGLGNILILFTIIEIGFLQGIIVGISKSIIGGVISGSLFTPSTILSLAGTMTSMITMFLLWKTNLFGILGLSIAGSIINTTTQVFIVTLILTGISSFFYLLKTLSIFSIPAGILTGLITCYLLTIIERRKDAFKSFS